MSEQLGQLLGHCVLVLHNNLTVVTVHYYVNPLFLGYWEKIMGRVSSRPGNPTPGGASFL